MRRLVLEHDWAATPVGPMADWPRNLRQTVDICLASQFPMIVLWGPKLIQIYNDGYRAILADKHPAGLGQPAHECWPEARDFNGPIYEQVLGGGEMVFLEDQEYSINRRGFLEETYFTVAYGPVYDDHGEVGGVFISAFEMTSRVLLERRLRTLQQLSARADQARSVATAVEEAVRVLADNPADLPFALVYLVAGGKARLAGRTGLSRELSPESVELATRAAAEDPWLIAKAVTTRQPQVVRATPPGAPAVGPVLALPVGGVDGPSAVLVAATSTRLALGSRYRSFLDSIATNLGLALISAHTYEAERRRADELAAADEAKTALLHSISHEFRTPLTLMLGPLSDLLEAPESATVGAHRERLRNAHRAAFRLSRLVDALLLAAQAEAGRLHANPRPVEIARYTADLASMFRSAIEQAGLRLGIDCPPLPAPALIDPTMWENIVLNLLSNAVKFTLAGEIKVALGAENEHLRLTVSDTGTGIPADAVPKT